MSSIRAILVVFFLAAIYFPGENSAEAQDGSLTYYTSMVNLLVQPANFEGKKISLVGYLARNDSPFVYLSREHALLNDISSGFPVYVESLSVSECMNRFVRVTGRLISDSPNEFAIADIENVWVNREGDNILTICSRPAKTK